MKIDFNFAPDTKVTLAANGRTESVDLWSRAHKLFDGHAGRVNVYDVPMTALSVGQAVVRKDGQTTVDLRDQHGPVDVSVALAPGRTGIIRTPVREQQRGMSDGLHYWLEQDAQGRFKTEPGRLHRTIYVSGSAAAMTRAEIAAEAGVTESTVNGAWLTANPQYGGSAAKPIALDALNMLSGYLYGMGKVPRSDHILFERGYTYDYQMRRHTNGESQIHPLVIGAWGTGARPVVPKPASIVKPGFRYIVFRDLTLQRIMPAYSYTFAFENCRIDGTTGIEQGDESNIMDTRLLTLKDFVIRNVHRPTVNPVGDTVWQAHLNRRSGLYGAPYGFLAHGCISHLNGWKEGYDINASAAFPHPPSMYSHGFYIQYGGNGCHVRDSLFSRNASQGLQFRAGGQVERSLFLDNNLAAGLHAGTKFGKVLHFVNVIDSVVYGVGYNKAPNIGAYNRGLDASGGLTGQIGCVVAHLADPDNPAEVSTRVTSQGPYSLTTYSRNDCQVFNWVNKPNERIEGLDQAVLMQTTIQRYAGAKLGQADGRATIDEFVDYLTSSEDLIATTVRDAVKWTKARFGRPILERTAPASLVFRPDPATDGFRWDNRLNWTTGDLPGMNVADTVDLDGHSPLFGTVNADIATLKSAGGKLDVTSGRLDVGGLADALDATVRLSGQLWVGATTQPVTARANGGRLAFTGSVSSLALEARGNAEVLLGPDATVPVGKAMVISGQRVMAGWDGTGTATLTIRGTLEFRAGITAGVTGPGYNQHLMDNGRRTSTATAQFNFDEFEEQGSSTTDRAYLSDLIGTPAVGETFVFGVKVRATDEVNEDVDMIATVASIMSAGISPLQVFRSGSIGTGLVEPTVAASLVLSAGSSVVIGRRDLLAAGTYDLTGPGVTVTDQGATLPEGVAVTGGKLVLVV